MDPKPEIHRRRAGDLQVALKRMANDGFFFDLTQPRPAGPNFSRKVLEKLHVELTPRQARSLDNEFINRVSWFDVRVTAPNGGQEVMRCMVDPLPVELFDHSNKCEIINWSGIGHMAKDAGFSNVKEYLSAVVDSAQSMHRALHRIF